MHQWKPESPSEFDDLVESPRWYQLNVVFAGVCLVLAQQPVGASLNPRLLTRRSSV